MYGVGLWSLVSCYEFEYIRLTKETLHTHVLLLCMISLSLLWPRFPPQASASAGAASASAAPFFWARLASAAWISASLGGILNREMQIMMKKKNCHLTPVCLGLHPEGRHLPLALDSHLAALLDSVGGGQQRLDCAGHVDILLLTKAHHPRARVHRVSEETVSGALVAHNAPDHLDNKFVYFCQALIIAQVILQLPFRVPIQSHWSFPLSKSPFYIEPLKDPFGVRLEYPLEIPCF